MTKAGVEESRSAGDRELDETLEETFPASDAPANTVETGTRIGPVPTRWRRCLVVASSVLWIRELEKAVVRTMSPAR